MIVSALSLVVVSESPGHDAGRGLSRRAAVRRDETSERELFRLDLDVRAWSVQYGEHEAHYQAEFA